MHPVVWHELDLAAVLERLGVDPASGLTGAEAARRLQAHGPNTLPVGHTRSAWSLFVAQFTDLMIVVLLASAFVAGMLGEPGDAIAIIAIVILNAVLGFVQEYRAEQAVAQLRALAAPSAMVVREGHAQVVAASALVPGDVVQLEAGNVVPADLRLVEDHTLQVDESSLTGESVPSTKDATAVHEGLTPLADRRNLAFKGTTVRYGRARAVVIATGGGTELGRVATLLEEAEDTRTPLQRRLKRFAAQVAFVVLVICVAIFAIGILRGDPPMLTFLTALSLAVAAMPEALPAVVTVALALGARRMVHHRALVRRLPAVETLGSVTWICSDKTGTLTHNRLAVAEVCRPPGWEPSSQVTDAVLLESLALNSDAALQADGACSGEPTEAALLAHAAPRVGVAGLRESYPRVGELAFSSERGRMTTLHRTPDGGHVLYMKGAPERVLAHCAHEPGGAPLDRERVLSVAHAMAGRGLRVLAFAMRRDADAAPAHLAEHDEWGFTCLGLIGLLDTPRPEARDAVAECTAAGIHVVMMTGDHPATADAVARDLGLTLANGTQATTGPMLDAMDDATLQALVMDAQVFARVAPEHKLRIVRALQAHGEFVAMTGDGVNDAPALRQADIGVAMGRAGTDVAREAADLVLLDDNFASIVAAVREGRRIYDNIRRFVRYVLTGNSAEIWLLFLAPLLGYPLPLLPIHILWVNLVTDGLPGLALAVEPAEPGVMRRAPRPPDESVFAHGVWQHALWVGLLMGVTALLTQVGALAIGSAHWQSMTFTVLALSQLGHVMVVRSERESLGRIGLWSNRPLALVVAGTVVLQLLVLYLPLANRVLATTPLTVAELLACLALSLVVMVAVEVEKALLRRGLSYTHARPRTT